MLRWKSAIFEIARGPHRFEHCVDCEAFDVEGAKCSCGAGPANIVLDEIQDALAGPGLPDIDEDDLCDGDVDITTLHGNAKCPKCGATAEELCKFVKP